MRSAGLSHRLNCVQECIYVQNPANTDGIESQVTLYGETYVSSSLNAPPSK